MNEQPKSKAALSEFRGSIDNLDAALMYLLAERFKLTKQVGMLKADHGMPVADPERETFQRERFRRLAKDANLDPIFAEKFFAFILEEVIRHHIQFAEGKK